MKSVILVSFLFCLSLKAQDLPQLLDFEDRKYSVVFFVDSEKPVSEEQKRLEARLARVIEDFVPNLTSSLSKSFAKDESKYFLQNFAKDLERELKEILNESRDFVTTDPQYLVAYILPWPKEEIPSDQISSQFPVVSYDLREQDNIFEQRLQFMALTEQAVRAVQAKSIEHEYPIYPVGASFHVHLQKKNSSFRVQLLTGIASREMPFEEPITNDQVSITHLLIPVPKISQGLPMSLVNLQQSLEEPKPPELRIELGQYGGLKGLSGEDGKYSFSIFDNLYSKPSENCVLKMQSVPMLIGSLESGAIPVIGRLFKGSKIQFRIFSMDFDMQKREFSKVDVRVEFGPFKCMNLTSIDTQFTNEANAALSEAVKELFIEKEDFTDELLEAMF